MRFEHHGRHAAGFGHVQAGADLLAVDVVVIQAQHGVDLAGIGGLDEAVDLLQGHEGLGGVLFGQQHGQGGTGPAFDEAAHFGAGTDAAGQQHAGDVGLAGGQAGGDGGQQDVGAVAGGHDELVLGQVAQEVVHVHGGDEVVAHQGVEMGFAGEHFGVQALLQVAHGGAAQGGLVRDGVDQAGLVVSGKDVAQVVGFGAGQAGAVDDGGDDVQGVGGHGVAGHQQGVAHFFGVLAFTAGDEHHGAAQVGGDLGVQFEFEDRVLAQEVGAHAEHEVVAALQFLELLDDVLDDQVAVALIDDGAHFLVGVGEGVAVVLLELEVFQQQVDVRGAVIQLGFIDDGAENGHILHVAAQDGHGAQGDGALAGARARGGKV